ncbi:unnamed protein product [Meloidogyne enterolobii]|uniref:Uncharacterized protein n=1 Tax=Meloidogyne enterolobii TaxID=390850 RepID=A0ACB0YAI9_MELEN
MECSKRAFSDCIALGPVWNCIALIYIQHRAEVSEKFASECRGIICNQFNTSAKS